MSGSADAGPRRSWLWKMAVLLIPGCGGGATASINDYVHIPTAGLHEQYDVANATYDPFRVGEVVIAPRFVAMNHTTTAIKLIAAAGTVQPVEIKNVRLSGKGGADKSWAETHSVELKQKDGAGVFKGYATFGELSNAEIDALSGGAQLTLAMDVKSGDASRSLSFAIETTSRTYLVTP